ncbi:MAG: hypothetical protein K2M46_12755, partial [Lachnospiraceae bacterium]|nr:hypothetical protein [Lachnospiraceae bacterium]
MMKKVSAIRCCADGRCVIHDNRKFGKRVFLLLADRDKGKRGIPSEIMGLSSKVCKFFLKFFGGRVIRPPFC